jgi:hypothetical protein
MNKRILYQKDSLNYIRQWSIWVEELPDDTALIKSEAGIVGGKFVETVTPITEGKNTGKKNQTSAYEQAVKDAESEIRSKLKDGYVDDINNVKDRGQTHTIKEPMKGYTLIMKKDPLKKYGGHDKTLDELKIRGQEIGLQCKLDGFRYRIQVSRKGVTFYSSGGDVVPEFPHISKSIYNSYLKIADYVEAKYGITEYFLDGEIYAHGSFNLVQSACGTKVHLTPEKIAIREKMKFYLFDVCLPINYLKRQEIIDKYFVDNVSILPVKTYIIKADEKAIKYYFEYFLKQGYEGVMLRLLDMPYEFKRTKQLIKHKPEVDEEFEIVGFLESIQKNTLGSFELVLGDGRKFNAVPIQTIGSDKMKKEIWDNRLDYIGKWVSVKFLEYTEDGIPRHPRAYRFRLGKSKD